MELAVGRFSGHESFTLRNTWLTKGVLECAEDPHVFAREDALVKLGVGKNMVDAIRYWCLAARVLEEKPDERGCYQPTDIGRKIFLEHGGWDPFLEDSGTVWLLHWLLGTHREYATTIYYAFNELHVLEFTRDSLEKSLAALADKLNARATANTIRRDVNVFVRSYLGKPDRANHSVEDVLDSPFSELDLLMEEPIGQTYAFSRGPKDSLPDAVILYALWEYAQQGQGGQTFTFDELAYRPLSPGRVFKLDEVALAERLERLVDVTQGAWQLTETAGYRQVLMREQVDPFCALDAHYVAQGTSHGRA
jgi:hypothetical protein